MTSVDFIYLLIQRMQDLQEHSRKEAWCTHLMLSWKILKATEVIFRRQVILSKTGIMTEKNVDLQIQYSVLEQLGPGVFSNSATHFYEHSLGFESDHLSSLLKIVTMEYLRLQLKTYGKKYTDMIVHRNQPSSRHELTKTILFRNQ